MDEELKLLQKHLNEQLAQYKNQLNKQVNQAILRNIEILKDPHLRALKTFKEGHDKMLAVYQSGSLPEGMKKRMINSEQESYQRQVKAQWDRFNQSVKNQLGLIN